jgi:hypothetical protein
VRILFGIVQHLGRKSPPFHQLTSRYRIAENTRARSAHCEGALKKHEKLLRFGRKNIRARTHAYGGCGDGDFFSASARGPVPVRASSGLGYIRVGRQQRMCVGTPENRKRLLTTGFRVLL